MKMEALNSLEASGSDYLCTQRLTRKQWDIHLLECSLCSAAFFFSWRWNSNWVVVCSTALFHVSLSLAVLLQLWLFILPRYSLTPSSVLNLRLRNSAQCQVAYRQSYLDWPDIAIHKNNLGKKGLNILENLSNKILFSPKIFTFQHHNNAHFL